MAASPSCADPYMDDGMNGGERRQEIHAGAGLPLIEAARRAIVVSRPIAGHHALPVACRAEMPVRRHDHGHRVNRDRRAERRIRRGPRTRRQLRIVSEAAADMVLPGLARLTVPLQFGLDTTSRPWLARYIRTTFPGVTVRTSRRARSGVMPIPPASSSTPAGCAGRGRARRRSLRRRPVPRA